MSEATEITFTLPIPPGSMLLNRLYGPGAPVGYGRRRIATVIETVADLDDDGMIVLSVTAELSPAVGSFTAWLVDGATDHLSMERA